MLKLFVLRHGKAKLPAHFKSDFERTLSRKGNAQVNQIGYILKEQNHNIGQLISSGALRTTETTEIINYYLAVSNVSFDDELYLSDRTIIQKKIAEKAKEKTLMIVGHNFGISDFVNYLADENLVLSTAMLVELNFELDSWSELGAGTGSIKQLIEPQVKVF